MTLEFSASEEMVDDRVIASRFGKETKMGATEEKEKEENKEKEKGRVVRRERRERKKKEWREEHEGRRGKIKQVLD